MGKQRIQGKNGGISNDGHSKQERQSKKITYRVK